MVLFALAFALDQMTEVTKQKTISNVVITDQLVDNDHRIRKWQNRKAFQGKTICVQSALARRVRLNFLWNGSLTSSAPFPPHTLWLHPQTAPIVGCSDFEK